ncbi:MAG: hypothetical protein NXH78_00295 [Hyphomonadaceae bacterium]|nr:hypothetical protein [Hyphomonadaceae bacterium]
MTKVWYSFSSGLTQTVRGAPFGTLAAIVVLASALTLLGVQSVPGLASLHQLADGPNPYFIPQHTAFLYVWIPLVTVAGCLALLLPGLLISLSLNKGKDTFGVWVLKGFAFSTLIVSLMASGAQIVLGAPLVGSGFAISLAVLNGLCLAFAYLRNQSAPISWQFLAGRIPDLILGLAAPILILLLFSPKFYWEDFTGDGAHLFLATLQYVQSGSPLWPAGSPDVLSNFPTLNAVLQLFASSWFVRLFGETAFAIRAVFLFGTMILAITLMEIIRFRHQISVPWRVAGALGAALLLYAYVLCFNASYDPYFADIGLPTSREPAIVFTFLGFVLFGMMKRYAWMIIFAALSYTAGPNGLILMGLWTGSLFLVSSRLWPLNTDALRTWPIKDTAIGLGVIGGVFIAFAILESLLAVFGLANIGTEFGGSAILQRLRYVTIDTWQRFAFLILPSGILPVIALAFWAWQDRVSRAMTLTSLFYFGFFYVQGFRILPHHFAPVMVLPLIVLWRLAIPNPQVLRNGLPALAVFGCAVAAVIVTPQTMQVHRVGSQFGASIQVQEVELSPMDTESFVAFDQLFKQAAPRRNVESAWQKGYIGKSSAWFIHALRPKSGNQEITYVVRRPGVAQRDHETLLAEWEGWTLVTVSEDQYHADLSQSGIPSSISPVFYVLRDTVFGKGERGGNRRVIDVLKFLPIAEPDTDSDTANDDAD